MNDFTRWLYANYIKPEVDQMDITGYETSLSLMDTALDPQLREFYDRTVEFHCGNAFLLGLRTGYGLADLLPRT